MRSVNAGTMCGVTNTITLVTLVRTFQWKDQIRFTYIDTDIESLGDPVLGNAIASESRQSLDILSSITTSVINVALQAPLAHGVTDKEDTLDGILGASSQLRKSVDGGSSTLRVTLEDDAFARVGREDAIDLSDNVASSRGRILAEVGRVYCR